MDLKTIILIKQQTNKMGTIKIIGRVQKSRNLYFCTYSPKLNEAIENFKDCGTVKVIRNVCYIQNISLGYFTEILSRNNVKFTVITTLN